jgi:4-hydroxy-tetrahydrodipicolinate reductase
MIRVGVIGAAGRMGRVVCRAVADADDLQLVAAIDRSHAGERVDDLSGAASGDLTVDDRLESLTDVGADVVAEFTHPETVMRNVTWCIDHGIHAVVGTTGISPDDLETLRTVVEREDRPNAVVASNFALGAVLMMRFAAEAARHFAAAEVIELHHDDKVDAPSGTSLATIRAIQATRREPWRGPSAESLDGVRGGDADGIRVHSVRLPGLLAHQEIIFGAAGETLTIRHDSTDRTSFMPGVLLAVRAVGERRGLTVGLEPLLADAVP